MALKSGFITTVASQPEGGDEEVMSGVLKYPLFFTTDWRENLLLA